MDFEDNDKGSGLIRDIDGIHKDVDVLLEGRPEELQRIQENRKFADDFMRKPVKSSEADVKAFGKSVNINAILKANIENRSIYTVNSLCDMFLSWRLEQLKKYLAKKRALDFNYMWLIILIIIIGGGLMFFMVFILPRLGGVV